MYSLDWLIPNKVAYARVYGRHTIEDMEQANADFEGLLHEAGQTVHLIMDMRAAENLPIQIKRGQEVLEVAKNPNLGWVVSVGSSNEIVKYVGIMIVKIFRLRFQRLGNMQDVIDFLHSLDPSLDWSAARTELLINDTELRLPVA